MIFTSKSNQVFHRSFRDVYVVSMRVEQEVANVFPGTLDSGPWSEQLNWITVGLRPAAARLQRFVEPPSQILPAFVIQHRAPRICINDTSNPIQRMIPTPFPNIEPNATDGIYVGGPPNLVMTEDTGLEENANLPSAPVIHFTPESIKDLFQLASEFLRYQRVTKGRVDPKILSRTNRY
jgi:hypothetical protein